MKLHSALFFRTALPLPGFVLHPISALVLAAVHVYLATGHLSAMIGGDVEWTHTWKGFGALAGAYVFAALASRSGNMPAGRPRACPTPKSEPSPSQL
jgi:hypothetical protein